MVKVILEPDDDDEDDFTLDSKVLTVELDLNLSAQMNI